MVNETIDKIELAFPLNELFDSVNLLSTYSAKNMTASGEDPVDAFVITKDEQPFVDACISKAISDLFAIFIKQTNTIPDSMFKERAINGVNCCGFSISLNTRFDGELLVNRNRFTLINNSCMDYLKNYILLEWAKVNKLGDDITIYANSLNENIRQIQLNNFELKKARYGKTYDSFNA